MRRQPALRRIGIAAVLLVCAILVFRHNGVFRRNAGTPDNSAADNSPRARKSDLAVGPRLIESSGRSPEEIVAGKVQQFGKSRRAIVQRLSERHQKDIPEEVQRFFDAVEAKDWEEIDRLFQAMAKRSAQYDGSTHDATLDPFWPAVLETYGAAQQAHLWPAKQLLDYSEAVLGSLRPGMVYIGGTDPGRFIPTLVNETSGGEQHVILTQNALADSRYQEYIRFLYGERLQLPHQADADAAFAEYIADATKRLEHDEQFPDEPKQLRPREKLERINGKVEASGFDAAMDVNERLLKFIVEKNPELSFAMEESFSMKSTYDGARPLGPILELHAAREDISDSASKSIEYWREKSSQIMRDGDAAGSKEVLNTWSKLIVSQGNLLAHQQYPEHAEQAYRLALQMMPRNTDAIIYLSEHYLKTGRHASARDLVLDYGRRNPDLKADLDKFLPQFK